MIYLDANVFYNYLFETPLTRKTTKILEKYRNDSATSFSTIEEAIYVVMRKLIAERAGIKNRYDARRYLRTKDGKAIVEESFESVLAVLFEYSIDLIEDITSVGLIEMYAVKYGLMPRDAQIVATCVTHGIKKIATFDTDFDAVKELAVIRE
ncbi:hypothetical protein A3L11_09700 [Thermococcus siculi]|uniref:Ribonuclease VapC n=1 Tax=Thermococcus siculi TaxID=72803 RepID=A0A2Z2MM86_9EURY|nr:PIN domain-containing protein [Thermococcus siculi]ASJ09489.1 hypothetical protein A3L11_09700 [Thermococcus siculi]